VTLEVGRTGGANLIARLALVTLDDPLVLDPGAATDLHAELVSSLDPQR
jgi:hypothetical protein